MNSKPCAKCCESLKTFGFKKIYYSDNYGKIVIENISDIQTDHLSRMQKHLQRENYK
jgi:deoxycytidylate deaminase